MTQVQLLDWTFLVDKNLTQNIYSSVDKGGADKCECSMCKNYIARRHKLFDASLKEFFKNLSVDIDKEYEVYYMGKEKNGLHLYGTWFDFTGQILDGPNLEIKSSNLRGSVDNYDLNSNLSIAIDEANKPSDSFFNEVDKVVQVKFIFTIPWTINEDEPK